MGEVFMVGAAPGRHANHDPERHALYPHPPGCTGHRLFTMTGLSLLQYLRIPRRNVIRTWEETDGGGFPRGAAKMGALRLAPMLQDHDVLFMGRQVAGVFDYEYLPILEWREGDGYRWAIVPHPSGRNRWYNDRTNYMRARRFVARAVWDYGRS